MTISFDTEKYLAKIDFTEAELDRLCVKKAEVVGLSSRQAVKILCEGVEYNNVPVWIHTDCGARHWYMKGLEAEKNHQTPPIAPTAAEYFKDAALMFPFPGGVDITGLVVGTTVVPYVFAVFSTNNEGVVSAVAVIGIDQNMIPPEAEEAYQTYREMYGYFQIEHGVTTAGPNWNKQGEIFVLYDFLNERFAEIPLVIDGVPDWTPPLVDCSGLSREDKWKIEDFLENRALVVGGPLSVTKTSVKRLGDFGSGNISWDSDGVEYDPGSTVEGDIYGEDGQTTTGLGFGSTVVRKIDRTQITCPGNPPQDEHYLDTTTRDIKMSGSKQIYNGSGASTIAFPSGMPLLEGSGFKFGSLYTDGSHSTLFSNNVTFGQEIVYQQELTDERNYVIDCDKPGYKMVSYTIDTAFTANYSSKYSSTYQGAVTEQDIEFEITWATSLSGRMGTYGAMIPESINGSFVSYSWYDIPFMLDTKRNFYTDVQFSGWFPLVIKSDWEPSVTVLGPESAIIEYDKSPHEFININADSLLRVGSGSLISSPKILNSISQTMIDKWSVDGVFNVTSIGIRTVGIYFIPFEKEFRQEEA